MCIYEVSEFENCFAERETKPADGLGRGRGRSVELVARLTACLCINRPKLKQARTVCNQRNRAVRYSFFNIVTMCHGHPRHHPCAHTSINWHYCPSALIDLETGYETPCSNMSFAAAQPTTSDCPLQNCQFKSKGGSWTCCSCQQGPNTQGWCTMPLSRLTMNPESFSVESIETTCDHGCCSKCIRYGECILLEDAHIANTSLFRLRL